MYLGYYQMKHQVTNLKGNILFMIILKLYSLLLEIVRFDKPLGNDDFILGNTRVSGFYRVNYDDDNWNKIIRQLATKKDVYIKFNL
jgi:hypothetical protein